MISIISPAKSMDFESELQTDLASEIESNIHTNKLIKEMKTFSRAEIIKLMKVSEKIAELNHTRFKDFNKLEERQAMFAFNGDVYNNIDKNTLSKQDLNFAQKHLRIMSGLYGILRPLDKIKPYRLEMSTKLKSTAPKGLHILWQEAVTNELNVELKKHKEKFLINIASNEYSAAIDKEKLEADIINIHFRENKNGELKNIAINAKRARGMMADYIIRNHIDTPANIKKFEIGGYAYKSTMSDDTNLFFVK